MRCGTSCSARRMIISTNHGFFRTFDALVISESRSPFSPGLRCGEDALAQQVEVGAAIHLPLYQLELVDPPFHRSGAPRQAQGRRDGSVVASDAVGEAAQLTAARRGDPGIEGVGCVLPDHAAEGPGDI